MPTAQEIFDRVDFRVPNSVSDANLITELDRIHKEEFLKLNKLKNEFEIYRDTTVADQLTYSLPSNCRIDNIVLIQVAEEDVDDIDTDTTWYEVEYVGLLDDNSSDYCYTKVPNGKYALTNDGEAIDTSDYPIRIYYYKTPTSITATTDTPELDSMYHDLLFYRLCHVVAVAGHNPDEDIANYYDDAYKEAYFEIEKNLAIQSDSAYDKMRVIGGEW